MPDTLSELLAATKIRGSLYFSTEFSGEWGVAVPAFKQAARFHYVARGKLWVRIDGVDNPFELDAGDMVVIPFGRAHTLSDQPNRTSVDLDSALAQAGFTGRGAFVMGHVDSGAPTRILCGHFEYDDPFVRQVFNQMPPAIVLREAQIGNAFWLHEGLRFLSSEDENKRPGREAMAHKISEMLFIEVMRHYFQTVPGGDGVLIAAKDVRISRALEAIHHNPNAPWTVEKLASEAGMSRAAFSDRFDTLLGMPPKAYLADWRLMIARRMIENTQLSLSQIASQVGYQSAAGFFRAFKRRFGHPPGTYRRAGEP